MDVDRYDNVGITDRQTDNRLEIIHAFLMNIMYQYHN